MRSWLAGLLRNAFGESVARMLGGAGLSLATAAMMMPLVLAALNKAALAIGGIPSDILNVALLFGFGEALSIIGSAMLTRLMMGAGKIGLRRASK